MAWFVVCMNIAGTLLMALNIPQSRYAYPILLVSSLLLLLAAIRERNYPNTLLWSSFGVINMIGIYRWF